MKLCAYSLLFTALAVAQSATSRFETDINGRRVEMTKAGGEDGSKTEYLQSVNGRQIPVERVEEKVVSEGPGGKVTERIVRKFDRNGQQNGMERLLIEETKRADGGSSIKATTWRSDVNGTLREAERRNTETRESGSTSTTDTVIYRPDINGTFETLEKRSAVTEKGSDRQQTSETVQRRNMNGQFYDALREVRVVTKQGDTTTENTANYELGATGQLELASQAVTNTRKGSDGGEVKEVSLYGRAGTGRAELGGQQIKEQQIIERKKGSDGSVVETLSVRRPTVNDPGRLSNPQKLSETVCKGKCE